MRPTATNLIRAAVLLGVTLALLVPALVLTPESTTNAATYPKLRHTYDPYGDVDHVTRTGYKCNSAAFRNSVDIRRLSVDSRHKSRVTVTLKVRDLIRGKSTTPWQEFTIHGFKGTTEFWVTTVNINGPGRFQRSVNGKLTAPKSLSVVKSNAADALYFQIPKSWLPGKGTTLRVEGWATSHPRVRGNVLCSADIIKLGAHTRL